MRGAPITSPALFRARSATFVTNLLVHVEAHGAPWILFDLGFARVGVYVNAYWRHPWDADWGLPPSSSAATRPGGGRVCSNVYE